MHDVFLSKRSVAMSYFWAEVFFEDFFTVFLEGFTAEALVLGVASAVFASVFFGDKRWASLDLIRAALFLWIMCFFAALSSKLAAMLTFLAFGVVTAFLTASFKTTSVFARIIVRFLSCFNFFFADLITGMILFYHVIL